ADVVHATGVAVPAVLDHGDVDVQDVAVLQHLALAGDAVADDVVDRGADGGRERDAAGTAAVTAVGRVGLRDVDDVFLADAIQFGGGHAALHVRGDDLQDCGGQPPGHPHLLQLGRGLDVDAHRPIIPQPPAACPGPAHSL